MSDKPLGVEMKVDVEALAVARSCGLILQGLLLWLQQRDGLSRSDAFTIQQVAQSLAEQSFPDDRALPDFIEQIMTSALPLPDQPQDRSPARRLQLVIGSKSEDDSEHADE
jgi:hypothetical protein